MKHWSLGFREADSDGRILEFEIQPKVQTSPSTLPAPHWLVRNRTCDQPLVWTSKPSHRTSPLRPVMQGIPPLLSLYIKWMTYVFYRNIIYKSIYIGNIYGKWYTIAVWTLMPCIDSDCSSSLAFSDCVFAVVCIDGGLFTGSWVQFETFLLLLFASDSFSISSSFFFLFWTLCSHYLSFSLPLTPSVPNIDRRRIDTTGQDAVVILRVAPRSLILIDFHTNLGILIF